MHGVLSYVPKLIPANRKKTDHEDLGEREIVPMAVVFMVLSQTGEKSKCSCPQTHDPLP